jgi:hypothetical protein
VARHSARIRRLTARLRGRHPDLTSARLARISAAEVVTEVARHAHLEGCPADQVPKDIDAALIWLDQQQRAELAKLPDEEREELLTRYPRLRTGTR